MTYIENVFICMASPLLIAALCMGRRQAKFFLCCLAGMGGMPALRLHQYLLCRSLRSRYDYRHRRDRTCGRRSNETPAVALLSSCI